MYVSDAITDVGEAHRQRVLDKLNTQSRRMENERMQCESESLEELRGRAGERKLIAHTTTRFTPDGPAGPDETWPGSFVQFNTTDQKAHKAQH